MALKRRLQSMYRPVLLGLLLVLGVTTTHADDDYVRQWGPPVGTAMPTFYALDQSGETVDLAAVSGTEGLLLFLNRSADW